MPTLAYVGTPARDGALAVKQGGQKGKGAPAMAKMVERIPTTALLPRIGSGPLKDVSNSSRQLSNISYLVKVSDKWTAGKGKRQSNECKTAIHLSLVNGFRSTDIAHHVAARFKHLGFEVQAREFQRVQDTVDRIERKLWLTQLSRFNSNKEAAFFI
mmetsp:Transcript_10427/g.13282  ORF Transcript_10427/g.13282 Transcript_10427/m.13282 type:complete len:157 (+) Transcript_10427:275-745(+)